MTIQELFELLTPEERRAPFGVNTGWEGEEFIEPDLIAVVTKYPGEPDGLRVVWMGVDAYILRRCEVVRLVYIPVAAPFNKASDIRALDPWLGLWSTFIKKPCERSQGTF